MRFSYLPCSAPQRAGLARGVSAQPATPSPGGHLKNARLLVCRLSRLQPDEACRAALWYTGRAGVHLSGPLGEACQPGTPTRHRVQARMTCTLLTHTCASACGACGLTSGCCSPSASQCAALTPAKAARAAAGHSGKPACCLPSRQAALGRSSARGPLTGSVGCAPASLLPLDSLQGCSCTAQPEWRGASSLAAGRGTGEQRCGCLGSFSGSPAPEHLAAASGAPLAPSAISCTHLGLPVLLQACCACPGFPEHRAWPGEACSAKTPQEPLRGPSLGIRSHKSRLAGRGRRGYMATIEEARELIPELCRQFYRDGWVRPRWPCSRSETLPGGPWLRVLLMPSPETAVPARGCCCRVKAGPAGVGHRRRHGAARGRQARGGALRRAEGAHAPRRPVCAGPQRCALLALTALQAG